MPDETPSPEATAAPEEEAPEQEAPEQEAPEDDATAEPGSEVDPAVNELYERFAAFMGDAVIEHADVFGTLVVRVRADAWRRAAEVARNELECDYLSFISGIDWQPMAKADEEAGSDTSAPVQPSEMTFGAAGSEGRLQVFAYVQSTSKHWGIVIKADVASPGDDGPAPGVASWVPVYAGADWHERECWEMYGVEFHGHPSLRHLYLPSEFEGHPLLKDFPLLARDVKPWPGLVDVEPMPGSDDEPAEAEADAS
jgi:NADH-quinone oxidoreductase subunit C